MKILLVSDRSHKALSDITTYPERHNSYRLLRDIADESLRYEERKRYQGFVELYDDEHGTTLVSVGFDHEKPGIYEMTATEFRTICNKLRTFTPEQNQKSFWNEDFVPQTDRKVAESLDDEPCGFSESEVF